MKRKTFEQKRQEVKRLTETMNQSIESYFETPEQMAEHLSFMMQFYQYSLRNTALIQSQFRGARAVGSYKFWQEKGLQVKKGEKAIKILVPNQTQSKFKDASGKWKSIKKATEQEKKLIKKGDFEKKKSQLYFARGSVFDVSQTDAKASDLPDIFPNRWLEGDVANYQGMLEAMKKVGNNLDVTVGKPWEELGSAKGVFYQGIGDRNNHIGLNPRNGELQNVKTLIHELAHAKLHSTPEKHFTLSSEEKEFQAEMTAYAVASYFGIDTSDYSLSYLANWTQGKELKDKARVLEEVRETAVEFIEIMEPELMKEQVRRMESEKSIFLQATQNREDVTELIEVNKTAKEYVIDNKEEEHTKGLYYLVDGNAVVGVNNSTKEAWTEEFDHIVKCKAWLKRYDLDIEKPQIFIELSEAPELDADSMRDFAKGNAMMEELEEKYRDDNRNYKTRYHIVFPETTNSEMSVVSMDRLDIGGGEFLNPYHQIRREGNLTEGQQMILDDAFYDSLFENKKKDMDKWLKGKPEKRKLQEVDMEMM
ncbi:LPD25 domain-containing protein [Virgibacillus dakarensis]|uniref:LPD25 domain-containing protein n=1 Tax=Virgibacillus dakarensis TaxID=1917889 RepID=UPI000B42F402|nr:LPD25 domain-containing protein [Virgibacillus dakarensis]